MLSIRSELAMLSTCHSPQLAGDVSLSQYIQLATLSTCHNTQLASDVFNTLRACDIVHLSQSSVSWRYQLVTVQSAKLSTCHGPQLAGDVSLSQYSQLAMLSTCRSTG